MSNPSSFCPVPKEQQPINEYQELETSWFFGWAKLAPAKYITKLIWVGMWSLIVTAPLAAASFPIVKYPIQFGIWAIGGSLVCVFLAAIKLYLGWIYIKNRLYNEAIFYEESGWYDGQTWMKPIEVITRDRLIVTYQVQPILQRLQRTFGLMALLFLAGSLVWNFL